jgi:hypothetical protein
MTAVVINPVRDYIDEWARVGMIHTALKPIKCWHDECGSKVSATKRCGACKSAIYCGPFCQRADWEMHKVECHSFAKSISSTASATAAAAASTPVTGGGFDPFVQMCIASSSPDALSEARKLAAEGKMQEAAQFVSLMKLSDQEIFLKEMSTHAKWKSVEVAVMLFKSKRQKEAMEIMEELPKERSLFMAAIGFTREKLLSKYKGSAIVS